jgi:hypothetical protein
MDKETDILNFEYSTVSVRDIGIVEPVLSYLELKFGYNIIRANISDNFCSIIEQYAPRIIITSNGIGTVSHYEMVKYASLKNIKVITFISEGDMVDIRENVEILFWGNNKDKVFYEYANLQWSEKNIGLILKHIPEASNYNIVCTGGTGFDRYKFLPLKSKTDFHKQYPQYNKYENIIGLAGFPFYFFLSDLYKKDGQWNNMHLDHKAAEIMGSQKEPLRIIYREIIKNNPDILFILKYHPSDIMKELSEFYELDQFENTLAIYKEETIDNVINISDLWIGFESTTCLEAWLLGKTTFICNPGNVSFIRSIISSGSPHYGSYGELNDAIHAYFAGKASEGFTVLEKERQDAIKLVIGFGDGLNHKRAGDFIHSVIDKPFESRSKDDNFTKAMERKHKSIELRKKLRKWLYKTPFILLPRVKKEYQKDLQKENEFKPLEREAFAALYKYSLTQFYRKKGIEID